MATDLKSFREELMARVSIVDVVAKKVPLKMKGKDFWGCCPFHNEKTPSFSVNEQKGIYYCFGCGAWGTAIDFEMKANGLSFMEALKDLANMVGMEVPSFKPVDPAQQTRALGYLDIFAGAAELYSSALFEPGGEVALNYLRGRGFDDAAIKLYRLGFAPRGNIVSKKYADKPRDLLRSTQLVRPPKEQGSDYDFFRERIMFPIHDGQGRIIAFSGRSMNGEEPKYINISETEFFHKRRTLYGLYFARKDIAAKKRAIIVEGQVDAIQMQRAGFGETIAPLGSALTAEHIQILLKMTKNLIFCFDGDTAGKKAAMRAVDVILPFMKSDLDVKILTLPAGADPDDILRKFGAEKMDELILGAASLADYLWSVANSSFLVSTPSGRANAEKFLTARTNMIGDEVLRRHIFNAFKNMMWENWRGAKTSARAAVRPPEIKNPMLKVLAQIIETYPALHDKYFEFISGFSIEKAGKNTDMTEAQADIFIKRMKAQEYIKTLKSDFSRAESQDERDMILSEISKTEKFLEETC